MMEQVTISQLRAWPPGKVAAQPTEVLAALADTDEVSERAYTAWPQHIRRLFEPARTVRLGKPRYAIEARRETEAA